MADPGVLTSTTDPVSQLISGAIVMGVFVLLALEKVHRVLVVMVAVGLIWGVTYLTPYHLLSFDASQAALDLNVLVLLASMMAVVGVLKETGVFGWAVARMMNRAGGRPFVLLALIMWFTALLSALCDNVTTVIFVAPMAYQMARAFGIRPAAFLLPVVIASNIGGTATLIGDPPNIMIASGAGLSFVDFIVNLTPPVVVMMLVVPRFAAWYFRRDFAAAAAGGPLLTDVSAIADPRLLRWALWISGLIFVGFFTHALTGMPTAVPAMIGAAALLLVQDLLYLRRQRPTLDERVHGLLDILEKEIEWPTLMFFAFLFIAVGAAVETGLIDTLATGLARVIRGGSAALGLTGAGTVLFAALLITWVSGVLSAIIDNIPFVAVMIPIVHRLGGSLPGDTSVLWWALALGACLGGNGSAIGASANVTVLGLAERAGTRIGFAEFARFGAVAAVMTLVIASCLIATHVLLGGRVSALAWSVGAGLALAATVVAWRRRMSQIGPSLSQISPGPGGSDRPC